MGNAFFISVVSQASFLAKMTDVLTNERAPLAIHRIWTPRTPKYFDC